MGTVATVWQPGLGLYHSWLPADSGSHRPGTPCRGGGGERDPQLALLAEWPKRAQDKSVPKGPRDGRLSQDHIPALGVPEPHPRDTQPRPLDHKPHRWGEVQREETKVGEES